MLHKMKNWATIGLMLAVAWIVVWYFFYKGDKTEEDEPTDDKQALIAQFSGRY